MHDKFLKINNCRIVLLLYVDRNEDNLVTLFELDICLGDKTLS